MEDPSTLPDLHAVALLVPREDALKFRTALDAGGLQYFEESGGPDAIEFSVVADEHDVDGLAAVPWGAARVRAVLAFAERRRWVN